MPLWTRWVAIPVALGLSLLLLLAAGTESAQDYQHRRDVEEGRSGGAGDESDEAQDELADAFEQMAPGPNGQDADGASDSAASDGAASDGAASDGAASDGAASGDGTAPSDGAVSSGAVSSGAVWSASGERQVEVRSDGTLVLGREWDGRIVELDPTGSTAYSVDDDGRFVAIDPGDTSGRPVIRPRPDGSLALTPVEGPVTIIEAEIDAAPTDAAPTDAAPPTSPPPTSPPTTDPPPAPAPDRQGFGGLVWWMLLGLGILLLAVASVFFMGDRRGSVRVSNRRDLPPPPPPPHDPTKDWAAFERFLAELRTHPDPSEAVRLAFAYAERGVGSLPGRTREATPREWLRNVEDEQPDLAALLRPLARSFGRVHYGDIEASSDVRDTAVGGLDALVRRATTGADAETDASAGVPA